MRNRNHQHDPSPFGPRSLQGGARASGRRVFMAGLFADAGRRLGECYAAEHIQGRQMLEFAFGIKAGLLEGKTDSPRRPHLRPRKGTNLSAGNPSPASYSASSRCQPCAPLARLKKYFQSFRANPFNQHTSAGSSMSARSTWRSLGVDFTPSEARSGEVEVGEVDLGLLLSPVLG